MTRLYDRLYAGGLSDCRKGGTDWLTVHACKSPCHQKAVGYKGSLDPDHPHYLALERPGHLYLNLVDAEKPIFRRESFETFLRVAEAAWQGRGETLLIHCNEGLSRAPSLALLF